MKQQKDFLIYAIACAAAAVAIAIAILRNSLLN